MLEEFRDTWEKPKYGSVNYTAKFNLRPGAKPFKSTLRHYEVEMLEELKKQVDHQLDLGVIRESKSEWAAAPHFVKKKTGEWRCVLDYRRLNNELLSDSYPIPRVWDNLRRAAGRKLYTTVDMNAGFWNVPIEEGCKHLTAFVTPFGTFEFNVIPFGIKNSPPEFQRAMDLTFAPLLGDNAFVYIDDIVICGDEFEDVMVRIRSLLELCRKGGFYLRLDKSEWLKDEVRYLGHVVGRNGIKVQEKKVKNITSAIRPTTKKALQSFLGMAGYLRNFISHYAETTAPLFELIKGKGSNYLQWTELHEESFNKLKKQVANTCTLCPLVLGASYVIQTDASEIGVGAVLMQVQDGIEVPIEFGSQKFNECQRNWDTRERELYAVVWAIKKWSDYLSWSHFTVKTDHNNLRYLISIEKGKVFRWALFLGQYDFTIEFISGETNNIADWLSRYAADEDDDELIDQISLRVGAMNTHSSKLCLPTMPGLEEFNQAYEDENIKPPLVVIRDGRPVELRSGRQYVPKNLRSRVFAVMHYGQSGHLGTTKTYKTISSLFYWPGMAEDIARYVRECLICTRLKRVPGPSHHVPSGTLDRPIALDLISLDHVGPLYLEAQAPTYFLVMIDHATRYMATEVVYECTADRTLKSFYQRWIIPHGIPRAVLTDNGSAFKGNFAIAVTNVFGCKLYHSAPHRPQGNGINESSHQALKLMIGGMWEEGNRDLQALLSAATHTHNCTPHSSLGISPYEALYGRVPYYKRCQDWTQVPSEIDRKLYMDRRNRDRMITLALREIPIQQKKKIKVGDVVVVWLDPNSAIEVMSGKTSPNWCRARWSLPMKVRDVDGTQLVVQRYGEVQTPTRVHVDKCRLFKIPESPLLKALAEVYTRNQAFPESSNKRVRISDLDGLDKDASRWLKDTFGAEAFEEGI